MSLFKKKNIVLFSDERFTKMGYAEPVIYQTVIGTTRKKLAKDSIFAKKLQLTDPMGNLAVEKVLLKVVEVYKDYVVVKIPAINGVK